MMMGFGLIVPLILIGAVVAYALGLRPQINQTDPAQTGQSPAEILKNPLRARGDHPRRVRADAPGSGKLS